MSHHALIFSVHYQYSTATFRAAGPHRIATFLRGHDWDIEVIDYGDHFTLDELKELVRSRVSSKTAFIGFSSFFNFWNEKYNQFTSWIKSEYPDIKTILGGQSVAKTTATDIDYWIDSFGEYAILELLKNLAGNGNPIKFDLEHFGERKLIRSIASYPAFPMESLKIIMEKRDFVESYEWLPVEFSRGCKFKCKFCNFPILGVKGDYTRSSEDFIEQMNHNYDNFGVKHYFMADETFNDSPEKIRKFADATEQLNFRPYFSGFMRVDLMIAHPETWHDLVRMNLGGHYYGVETFNLESAKLIGKGMHPDKVKQGLLDIKSYFKSNIFYRGTISLIVGLPHETHMSMRETDNWLSNNWTDQAIVVFPFDVEDIKGPNLKNQTNVSEFGKNIDKYGIRQMDPTGYQKLHSEHFWDWRHGNYAADKLIWEHDTMNIFEADRISKNLQNKKMFMFKEDNWSVNIGRYDLTNRSSDLSITLTDVADSKNKVFFIDYVRNYKHKKLSWKP